MFLAVHTERFWTRAKFVAVLGLSLSLARDLSAQPQSTAAPSTPAAAQTSSSTATQQRPPVPAHVLPPPKDFDLQGRGRAVLNHLNAVVRVFRLALAPIQKVGEPSDMLYRDQALLQSTQIAELAFQSSRAEASLLSAYARQLGTAMAPAAEGEAQKLQTIRAGVTQRLVDLKTQLQSVNQHLATAKPRQRAALQQQKEETEGDIDLYEAMSDSMRKIALTSDSASGAGLAGDIDRLQRSVPELAASKAKTVVPTPLESLSTARSAGVSSQATVLFQLLATRHSIDTWVRESDDLHDQAIQLRTPLTVIVRAVVASGQTLSQQTEAEAGAAAASAATKTPAPAIDIDAVRHRYETITSTFNTLSAALVPLTQEIITLEQSRANLLAWRAVVDQEYKEVLRALLFRVLGIAAALGVLFLISSFWQRATTRYVHDVRRRRQLLVTRRVVVSFIGGLIVIFGFVTQFTPLATFAGFITAGIAVGLQTILLSVAAYFFIVGRYGVRVGDRITVAGVTGDVIDVGLVRFYMMELAGTGTELQPTGRVAVFANSVLFQSGTPLYRQMPGADYGWHELSMKLTPEAKYAAVSERVCALVDKIYDSYKTRIEAQHRQVEAWMDSPIPPPAIDSRLQLVDGGLQFYVRYPVELRQGSAIDQQVTRSLMSLIADDSEVKDAIAGTPVIRALVKS